MWMIPYRPTYISGLTFPVIKTCHHSLSFRFNTPRRDIVRLDEVSTVLLSATNLIKADNNLTDLQAIIGLRSSFNSDTSSAISERCPWVPAPTCDPNKHFRTWDGSCNNLRDPNLGRTGTPYQRILLPEYAKVRTDCLQ